MNKYKGILETTFKEHKEISNCTGYEAKCVFISELFGFTTYDSEMDLKLVGKMVNTIRAINEGRTFDFIKNPKHYEDYITCVNFPWFQDKLEWGGSIRGAWWNSDTKNFSEFAMWVGCRQVILHTDDSDEWSLMINALLEFWYEQV